MAYYGFAPYVSVAQRRAKAKKKMDVLRKKGKNIQPIEIEGRKITRTFWGDAWCNHLEKYSDYSNRLPRGRTYARNGSVCHLEINKGTINAFVSGSSLYNIEINIAALSPSRWKNIKQKSSGKIGSLLELLQGKISKEVMEMVTQQETGLFPSPKDIKLNCDCPDWATMCKHVAAVLYGIGARLDHQPELLFILRGVDHNELITGNMKIPQGNASRRRVSGDLSDVFGIEINDSKPTKKKSAIKIKKEVKKKTAGSRTTKIRPSGKSVARLRKRFGMNLVQFSNLIGVSPTTISNWENQTGLLSLKVKSYDSLSLATKLDKAQAWKKL